jgi:predicted deacetylase
MFEGIEIPEAWMTTKPLYLEYITEMNPMQRTALHIAMTHLQTSFDLERSNGFVEWLAKRVAPSSESR